VLFIGVGMLVVAFAAVAALTLNTVRHRARDIARNQLPSVRIVESIRSDAHRHRELVLSHVIAPELPAEHLLERR
jgi:hypothetical protein